MENRLPLRCLAGKDNCAPPDQRAFPDRFLPAEGERLMPTDSGSIQPNSLFPPNDSLAAAGERRRDTLKRTALCRYPEPRFGQSADDHERGADQVTGEKRAP
jgi:hypothetical protein